MASGLRTNIRLGGWPPWRVLPVVVVPLVVVGLTWGLRASWRSTHANAVEALRAQRIATAIDFIEHDIHRRESLLRAAIFDGAPGEREVQRRLAALLDSRDRFTRIQFLDSNGSVRAELLAPGISGFGEALLPPENMTLARKWAAGTPAAGMETPIAWALPTAATGTNARAVCIVPAGQLGMVIASFPGERLLDVPGHTSSAAIFEGTATVPALRGTGAVSGIQGAEVQDTSIRGLRGRLRVALPRDPAETGAPAIMDFVVCGLGAGVFLGLLCYLVARREATRGASADRSIEQFQAAPLLLVIMDENLIVTEINDTACELLALPREELVDQSFTARLLGDDSPLREAISETVTGTTVPLRLSMRGGGNQRMDMDAVARVDLDRSGHRRLLLAGRIAPEVQSTMMAALHLENFGEGMMAVSEEGVILACNLAARNLLRVPSPNVTGWTLRQLLPGEDWNTAIPALMQAGRLGQRWVRELASVEQGVIARLSGVADHGKRGRALLLSIRRPTETERAGPRPLAESRMRYQTIFNSTPIAIVVLDAMGIIVETNASFRNSLATALDWHVESRRHSIFEHPAIERAGIQGYFERLFKGEELFLPEVQFPAAQEGVTKVVSIKGIPTATQEGVISGALLFMEDVSERYRLQQQVWAYTIDLEQERDRVVEASRLKNQFIATISHELRTPLNAIIGFSRLVQKKAVGALDDKQMLNLQRITESGEALLKMITDLLDISKIEAGRFDLTYETVSLPKFLTGIAEQVRPVVERNGNRLKLALPEDLGDLECDPMRLRQVLINLLDNASKFTQAGEIYISAGASGEGRVEEVTIEIADTGIGMHPDELGRIFDEFYQVDGSSTRHYGGTGLGLAICRKIIQAMGGIIAVESEPGLGSHFFIKLPRRAPQDAKVAAPQAGRS